jgi:hypothetical protein
MVGDFLALSTAEPYNAGARSLHHPPSFALEPIMAKGFLEKRRERRKLGVTLKNAIRIARQLKENNEEVTAENIALVMIENNPQAFERAGERDWESFFTTLLKIIEAIMPIIQMFMLFGG